MLRLRVKHLISGVLSVSAWCVAFVFGHRYDAEATPVVGNKLSCGGPASFDSYNVYTGYSFEDGGSGVCVFVCKPGYTTYNTHTGMCSAAAHTGCGRAFTGTDYNSMAWYAWINTECSTGCAYSGDAATTELTNAVYNYENIGASGLYFYTGCKDCSYNGTPPQKCEGIRFYAKFNCGAGTPKSAGFVGAMGAQVGENFTFPGTSNCTAPAGQSFSQWIGS